MSRPVAVVRGVFLWSKLDHPGHDCCRLCATRTGWRLTGVAVFWDGRRICHLRYDVTADAKWRTKSARVRGRVGRKDADVTIRSLGGGRWLHHGVERRGLSDCVDVDLGFTPATNPLAIRRLSLRVGQRADAPAAYLRFPELTLTRLPQTYTRVARFVYAYCAPTVGYRNRLRVDPAGAIVTYPGLFARVSAPAGPARPKQQPSARAAGCGRPHESMKPRRYWLEPVAGTNFWIRWP